MTHAVVEALWPVERLPDAVEQLAERVGCRARAAELTAPEPAVEPSRIWMFALASRLGIELEPVVPLYRELPVVVRRAAPAVLQVRRGGRPHYVVLLGTGRSTVRVLTPDARVVSVKVDDVVALLREEEQAGVASEIDALLAGVAVRAGARARVRSKMFVHRLGQRELRTGWIMRPQPSARGTSLWGSLPALLAGVLANHVLLSLVLAGSFWVLGRAALQAHLEAGWFQGWIVVIASSIPLRMLEVWWQGQFSIRVGALLRQQLLAGVLKLTPDEIRHDGVGRHFGRVAESEAVELLALGGGLLAILSIVDLVIAGFILQRGAGGWAQVVALVAWTALAVVLTGRHYVAQRRWSMQRIDITHDLLERMIGHRTRLAQLPLERWHDGEDRRLSGYADTSRAMDTRTMHLSAFLPGGWLVIALLTLLPAFAGGRATASDLAIAVGGILLAMRAFDEIAVFFQQLSLAASSFEQIRPLLRAVVRPEPVSKLPLDMETGKDGAEPRARGGATLVEARGLTFRHQARARAVLEGTSLRIAHGDRILLEGPSGGGKSTLVSLLTGLRAPDAGVLLLRGLDRATFGVSGWRRRVAAAPQFHENHVLSGSLAYNLLLGREWPVSLESREEARAVCRELGLDELIAKMPSGLDEMVGDTGWQLSHGEKSRLYIARTLLQGAELVVLDESFASLDPETMGVVVRSVLKRAPAVLVVSHP
jgi:ABC-type multidrug transport system fused ATPase/permease subunit